MCLLKGAPNVTRLAGQDYPTTGLSNPITLSQSITNFDYLVVTYCWDTARFDIGVISVPELKWYIDNVNSGGRDFINEASDSFRKLSYSKSCLPHIVRGRGTSTYHTIFGGIVTTTPTPLQSTYTKIYLGEWNIDLWGVFGIKI